MGERGLPFRGPYLWKPTEPREGEVIGGGFFVFRRGDETKRVRCANWPFEYDSQEAARTQAKVLAEKWPGHKFDIVQVVETIIG